MKKKQKSIHFDYEHLFGWPGKPSVSPPLQLVKRWTLSAKGTTITSRDLGLR